RFLIGLLSHVLLGLGRTLPRVGEKFQLLAWRQIAWGACHDFSALRIWNVGPTPRGVILLGLSRAMVRRRTPPRKKRTVPAGRREAVRLHMGSSLGGSPAKRSNVWVLVILAGLVLVNLYVFVWDKKTSVAAIKQK